jgi:6-hydroxycyclohex-1-ene-1-carbonyl-CoA dehydrogenase
MTEKSKASGAREIRGYEMTAVGEPLARMHRAVRPLEAGEVLVRVAGCGVCHTDLGYYYDGVRTRHSLPLILGHEISGHVEDAGPEMTQLLGQAVVVPAVLPCGECELCRSGRPTICRNQVMPGNDCDGGFATHAILPGRFLCPVPGAKADPDAQIGSVRGLTLRHLAVVADAVSTAYQAVRRSGLKAGQIAIVVGLGGVGTYVAQFASDIGAAVVGIDVDLRRVEAAEAIGVGLAIDPRNLSGREIRSRVVDFAHSVDGSEAGWSIFECSGTAAGQKAAFGQLGPGATLMVIGFTLDNVELRLSNLMAFDARALGNWGCAPEHYPAILEKVLAGRVDIVSHTEIHPLSEISRAFDDILEQRTEGRLVLAPDARVFGSRL